MREVRDAALRATWVLTACSLLTALELGYRRLDTMALYGPESAISEAMAKAVRR